MVQTIFEDVDVVNRWTFGSRHHDDQIHQSPRPIWIGIRLQTAGRPPHRAPPPANICCHLLQHTLLSPVSLTTRRGMRRSFKFATRGINLDADAICLGLTWPVPTPVLCAPNITLVCTLWSTLLNNAEPTLNTYQLILVTWAMWLRPIELFSVCVYLSIATICSASDSYFYVGIVLWNSQITSRCFWSFGSTTFNY